jgi:4a-hydroxytetrahydrobiopterin dehydratase
MVSGEWKLRGKPERLERKYLFDNYDQLRDFLDDAEKLSEKAEFYPDMGFGKDYVNVTIHSNEGEETLADNLKTFADDLDNLLAKAN